MKVNSGEGACKFSCTAFVRLGDKDRPYQTKETFTYKESEAHLIRIYKDAGTPGNECSP